MPGNTKLVLGVCHPPDTDSHMSCFSKFIPSISKVISPHIMNQSNAADEGQIDDAIDKLSEGLYTSIAAAARNFDIPTQTL